MNRSLQAIGALLTVLLFTFGSCEKTIDKNSVGPYRAIRRLTDTRINGTIIFNTSNAAGIIVDSRTGQGIEGVPVTDGYTFTRSDSHGVYQMQTSPKARKIYYCTPSGYKIAIDPQNHLPAFFSEGRIVSGGRYRIDFALEPMDAPGRDFTLMMVGDPQCSNEDDVGRFLNETVNDLSRTAQQYGEVYAITLGDETFDSYGTWEPVKNAMKALSDGGKSVPFFQCIGNHDHNSLVEDTDDDAADDIVAKEKFEETFGPADYSFNRGDVHIIVMDDICINAKKSSGRPNKATWGYVGGITDEQLEWLRQDIDNVDDTQDKMCILCAHIPFRNGSNESSSSVSKSRHHDDVLQLLTRFRECHIMIGHTHYQQNYIHDNYVCRGGQPIYEHIHGSACGAWWTADCNVTGGPNGYNVYSISGANVTGWYLKGANKSADYQMRVYDGNQIFTGRMGFEYSWNLASMKYLDCTAKGTPLAKDSFVAEVFDDDKANWKVEFYQNGVKKGDFTRVADEGISNVPLVSYWFNEKKKRTSTWTSTTASHYWVYDPEGEIKPSEMKDWEVRATFTVPTNPSNKMTYTRSSLTTDYLEFDR